MAKPKKDAVKLTWDYDTTGVDEYLIFWNYGTDTSLFPLIDSAEYSEIWEYNIGSVIVGLSDNNYEYFYVQTKNDMKNTWLRLGVIAVNGSEKSLLSIIPECIKIKNVNKPVNLKAN